MLPETYDDLDRHLPEADDIAAAAVPSGVYLAWCVQAVDSQAYSMLPSAYSLRLFSYVSPTIPGGVTMV